MNIAIDHVLDHNDLPIFPADPAAIDAGSTTLGACVCVASEAPGSHDVRDGRDVHATDSQLVSAERAFVARLKAGDNDAYEELVRTRGGHLLAVARRLLRDEDAARDAVQDAFLSAFRAIQRFDGHAQLSTWLHRIVVNAALMRIRSRQRRPEQSIEPLLPHFAEDGHHAEPVVSWTDSGADALEAEQTRALVRAGIDELPERHRTVLVLRDIDGLSTREVADLLGASENAVKLRLHRARQALAVIIRKRLATPATAPASRADATSPGPSAASASRVPAALVA